MNWKRILVPMALLPLGGFAAAIGSPAQAGAAGSGHLAGYSAPPGLGPNQTVSVTLVVPKIDCKKVPAGGFQAVLAGARVESGSGNSEGGAVTSCPGPVATYSPLIEISGVPIGTGITINAGDIVSVVVSESPGGATVTLSDGAQSQTASGPGGAVSAESVGDIAGNCIGSTCSPVPKSATTKFTAASINGTNLVAAGAVQQNLLGAAGGPQMTSSALTTKKTLNAFKTKWVSSCSFGPGRC